MGTNYYLIEDICTHCGRGAQKLHVGKSSYGWCFGLHVVPDEHIHTLADWELRWALPTARIVDEYGTAVRPEEMAATITQREGVRLTPSTVRSHAPEWWRINSAVPGPHGLARHRVDGHHCVGHGAGTWDLIAGEFS